MKKIFVLLFAAFALYSCGGNTAPKEEEKASVEDFSNIAKGVKDEHNAQNSLDYEGTYKGLLPTASGSGMEVTIVLTEKSFTKTIVYVGKSDKAFEEKGTYKWDESGSIITLDGADVPNQYFVGENTLTQLDIEGKRIEGKLAASYILKKAQ